IAEILRIGCEIAEGLAAAHEKGLIHRDIKPANIWLTSRPSAHETMRGGRVKILDFGLARLTVVDARLTAVGQTLGTPHYMAPEQGRGEAVDHRADLFSLGCVLYQLASGTQAFAGDSAMTVLTALATVTPRPVSELRPDLPPALDSLISRLL